MIIFAPPEGGHEAAEAMLSRIEHHVVSRLEDLSRRRGRPVSFRKIYSHFRIGSSAEQIVQLAANVDADLVVVGTHGYSGLRRIFLGSVAETVLRLVRCPVWVVRPKDHEVLGRVPEIEPPCKDCLAKRSETGGATFWCERHSEQHVRAHAYHYVGGEGSDRQPPTGNTTTPV